jgi:hypothetical protein
MELGGECRLEGEYYSSRQFCRGLLPTSLPRWPHACGNTGEAANSSSANDVLLRRIDRDPSEPPATIYVMGCDAPSACYYQGCVKRVFPHGWNNSPL